MENNETKKNEQEFRELSDEELAQVSGGYEIANAGTAVEAAGEVADQIADLLSGNVGFLGFRAAKEKSKKRPSLPKGMKPKSEKL